VAPAGETVVGRRDTTVTLEPSLRTLEPVLQIAAYLQADDEATDRGALDPASILCQFCGKSSVQVPRLFQAKRKVRDPNTDAIAAVWICNECVARMAQTLA
jgi:hypothetical protein